MIAMIWNLAGLTISAILLWNTRRDFDNAWYRQTQENK